MSGEAHTQAEEPPLRVFVSFAREGNQVLPRLIAHLEKQTWDVWIYDRPSAAVPMTSELVRHVEAELARCNLCIVFVTRAALSNEITQFEVRTALEMHERAGLKIAVLVDSVLARELPDPATWPEPYAALRFRYALVEPNGIVSVGEAVHELCSSLERKYVPLLAENGRVLLLTRFYQEMDERDVHRTPRENDVFTYLVRLLESIHQAFDDGDEARATQLLQLCLLYAEKEYPDRRFQYWNIMNALHQARAGNAPGALEILLKMREQPLSDSLRESGLLPAAVGYCHYQLSNYEAALEQYLLALQCHDVDVSTASNILLCRLRLKRAVSLPRDFEPLDAAKHYPDDNVVVLFTKALAYRLNGQWSEAKELLQQVLSAKPRFPPLPEIVEEYFRVLVKLGQFPAVQAAFERLPPEVQGEPRIMRALAKAHRESGDIPRAQSLWRELGKRTTLDVETFFEVIVGLWNTGDGKGALGAAGRFAEQHALPKDPFAYYVSGVVQWLLGNRERAEYDLARSGKDRHYRTLLREA